jgi:hypothetical protein
VPSEDDPESPDTAPEPPDDAPGPAAESDVAPDDDGDCEDAD